MHPGHSATLPTTPVASTTPVETKSDWATLQRLFPYLWTYKWRVIAALAFMVGAKVANVSVPLLLKDLVDAMTFKPGDPAAILVVPVALLLGYGAL
jgi:ATP-binding cassette subfamily B protein